MKITSCAPRALAGALKREQRQNHAENITCYCPEAAKPPAGRLGRAPPPAAACGAPSSARARFFRSGMPPSAAARRPQTPRADVLFGAKARIRTPHLCVQVPPPPALPAPSYAARAGPSLGTPSVLLYHKRSSFRGSRFLQSTIRIPRTLVPGELKCCSANGLERGGSSSPISSSCFSALEAALI